MSCRVFHLRCVCVPGKQKHIRLTPVAALNGDNVDSVKIVETKGCSVFCTGLVRQGTSHVLCVAIKRNIMLYELNRTKIRHRRIKDITCPGNVQFIEMMNERLCVGYPSSFAIYSVQGDSAPQGEAGYNFFHLIPGFALGSGFSKSPGLGGSDFSSPNQVKSSPIYWFPKTYKMCVFTVNFRSCKSIRVKFLVPDRAQGSICVYTHLSRDCIALHLLRPWLQKLAVFLSQCWHPEAEYQPTQPTPSQNFFFHKLSKHIAINTNVLFMKKQLIWVFKSRKSVHYWWNYITFVAEYKVRCPTCCYQVCALCHAKWGTADLEYPSEPCHCNVFFQTIWYEY